ncbi:hypothetical protein EVJ32_04600 [Exiguobacterium sp. SH5S4]|uniref:hypothetical protein n=1 Tax=Exiguobacterium sp. SH5S4 TaxID=2510961 RepID=UPI00103A50FE|nr:hypothetical protein [Exiguobacterium sp. SH5S4]TCI26657.1 hypothetical protein EVJ32_04600 [Exiguobacterium sp. SH5S4]
MRKVTMNSMLKDYESVQEEVEYNFLIVFVSVDGAKPEMIVNPRENVDAKMVYYRSAYDNDLRLKANPKIQIVDYQFSEGDISLNAHYRIGVGEL